MKRTFSAIASELNIPFFENFRSAERRPILPSGIYFDDHCLYPDYFSQMNVSGLRMIRDPRDVVISGAHYHCIAKEDWLNKPSDRFQKRSYQQAISRLNSDQEKYRFEMKYTADQTIKGMVAKNEVSSLLNTIYYEDLIADDQGFYFASVVGELGFNTHETEIATKCFKRHSLPTHNRRFETLHIRSGVAGQWRTAYDKKTALLFHDLHQQSLIELGYETDDSWLDLF